jgi:hypothetical protein
MEKREDQKRPAGPDNKDKPTGAKNPPADASGEARAQKKSPEGVGKPLVGSDRLKKLDEENVEADGREDEKRRKDGVGGFDPDGGRILPDDVPPVIPGDDDNI